MRILGQHDEVSELAGRELQRVDLAGARPTASTSYLAGWLHWLPPAGARCCSSSNQLLTMWMRSRTGGSLRRT